MRPSPSQQKKKLYLATSKKSRIHETFKELRSKTKKSSMKKNLCLVLKLDHVALYYTTLNNTTLEY